MKTLTKQADCLAWLLWRETRAGKMPGVPMQKTMDALQDRGDVEGVGTERRLTAQGRRRAEALMGRKS